MKVLYVSTLERGGPIAHMRGLIPHVAAHGVDVVVSCQTDRVAELFERLGVRTVVAPIRDKADVPGAIRLWPEASSADVVHSQDRRAGLYARLAGRARGARVAHTFHGLPEEIAPELGNGAAPNGASTFRRLWLVHGYLRIEASLARLGPVVTPSHAMARYLTARGVPADRLRLVPSGIDVRRSEPAPVHSPPRVGTVTNLSPWKGVDVFLEACARLSGPVAVEVYGTGPGAASLRRRASELGLDAAFHGHRDDVRERLEALDVFVLPSRAENFPIALLEAMAAGLPVVATRVGGVPEIVTDGVSGLLVPPGDIDAMTSAIEGLLRDEHRRRELGRNGAAEIARRFDPADAGLRMVEVYEELCGSSR
jgi:glycosyltransferase involved in cell wall biosynthesis